jgi:hypothetical protein
MDEEDGQIYGKEFPCDEYFCPVEGEETIVYRTDIQT